jgi:hypothetical protein
VARHTPIAERQKHTQLAFHWDEKPEIDIPSEESGRKTTN